MQRVFDDGLIIQEPLVFFLAVAKEAGNWGYLAVNNHPKLCPFLSPHTAVASGEAKSEAGVDSGV